MLTDVLAKDCTRGKWHSETVLLGAYRDVFHYSTRMLRFEIATGEVSDYSIGYGSVSDQNGMNKLFRALSAPYYFSRKGGAEIKELENV